MISTLTQTSILSTRLNSELHALYQQVRISVVLLYRNGGNGAGVIWSTDGLIVTNNHVVSGDGKVNVVLADGRTYLGIVAGRHPTRDLAVIKIIEEDLPAAAIADSSLVRPGEIAAAIGHPLGYRDAVTAGIIVAAGHSAQIEGSPRGDIIQTDAQFAPGNSGGPLVNCLGQVIGISTRVSGSLGLAVPSAAVEAFVRGHRADGNQAHIGISGQFVPLRTSGYDQGFLITDIPAGMPADRAGLILGDVIVIAAGNRIVDQESLPATLLRSSPGTAIPFTVLRGGEPREFSVVPGDRDSGETNQH
ncbi:trypsin-like peptidase domain-containing protein [soil metagenome]